MRNEIEYFADPKLMEQQLLKEYKLKKDPNYNVHFLSIMLVLLPFLLFITQNLTGLNLKDGIEIILAITVTVTAYWQWRAARHEISIDKYYDRLDDANNRLEKLDKVDLVALQVFSEMDKLEYVIMKYKIGFMPPNLVFRAMENFKSLCKYRNNFHTCATKCIQKAAYLPETQKLVAKFLEENLPEPDFDPPCD